MIPRDGLDFIDFDTLDAQLQQMVKQVKTSNRPLVITREGDSDILLIDAADYEWQQRRFALLTQIAQSKLEIAAGRYYTEEEVDALIDAEEEMPPD